MLKKCIIEKSCIKLKFTLILKEFRFVQRVAGGQGGQRHLVASAEAKFPKPTVKCIAATEQYLTAKKGAIHTKKGKTDYEKSVS